MNKQLKSFIKYCEKYPEQRFWQALRNFSEYDVIFGYKMKDDFEFNKDNLENTFYKY